MTCLLPLRLPKYLLWCAGLAVLLVTSFSIEIGSAAPAHAFIFTCGTQGNYHISWWSGYYPTQPNQYEGASANMTYEFANVCQTDSTAHNFTNSYSMVESHDGNGWAQSGMLGQINQTCFHHFAQQLASGVLTTAIGSCVLNNGETHNVWQQLVQNPRHIRSNIDSTIMIDGSFDPYASWVLPFQVEFSGETGYQESDVPGGNPAKALVPTDFLSGMQVQLNQAGDPFVTTCNNVSLGKSTQSSRYGGDAPACDHVRVWTI